MIDNDEVKIFHFQNNEVRTKLIDNEPYFNLTDACKILEIQNTRNAKARLNEDGVRTMDTIDRLGRTQQANFISEPNLYKLIFQSRKPEAEKFADWVTSEVLPAIVHKGVYMTDDVIEKVIKDPDFIIKLATELKEEKTKRLVAEQQVYELKPKATYYDLVLQNKSLLSVTQIAKDYGKSAKWLNEKLHELGMQYKQGSTWLLYQKYADKGYTQSTTHVIDECNAKIAY